MGVARHSPGPGSAPAAPLPRVIPRPKRRAIVLLDVDPDLGEGIEPVQREIARAHALAPLETVSPGRWQPAIVDVDPAQAIGLLVVSGLLSRAIALTSTTFIELIGPGEIVRPWDRAPADATPGPQVGWEVLAPGQAGDPRWALSPPGPPAGPSWARRSSAAL